jgi:hypothetical protein
VLTKRWLFLNHCLLFTMDRQFISAKKSFVNKSTLYIVDNLLSEVNFEAVGLST